MLQLAEHICVCVCVHAASGGESNVKDEASKEAAEMIAKAKAKAKASEGPGVSVLHEACRSLSVSFSTSCKDAGRCEHCVFKQLWRGLLLLKLSNLAKGLLCKRALISGLDACELALFFCRSIRSRKSVDLIKSRHVWQPPRHLSCMLLTITCWPY